MQATPVRDAIARLRVWRQSGRLELEARTLSSRVAWEPPATVVSLAGLHGGAGTSTLCLLLAEAIATFGEAPALAVDLAGRSRGGLAVLGGAAGHATAEGTCAVAAIHGGRLEQPFGINEAGVRIIGAYPDGVEELDRGRETLTARLVEAVRSGADDARLAELARFAVRLAGAAVRQRPGGRRGCPGAGTRDSPPRAGGGRSRHARQ
jgi:hypothetical protein